MTTVLMYVRLIEYVRDVISETDKDIATGYEVRIAGLQASDQCA